MMHRHRYRRYSWSRITADGLEVGGWRYSTCTKCDRRPPFIRGRWDIVIRTGPFLLPEADRG